MHLICPASCAFIDLDALLDAKTGSNFFDAHDFVDHSAEFDRRYDARTEHAMTFDELRERVSANIAIYFVRLNRIADDHAYEIALVDEEREVAMLLCGTFDRQTNTFVQSSDTCAQDDFRIDDHSCAPEDIQDLHNIIFLVN